MSTQAAPTNQKPDWNFELRGVSASQIANTENIIREIVNVEEKKIITQNGAQNINSIKGDSYEDFPFRPARIYLLPRNEETRLKA